MTELPTGTVTFLLTDVEGSTPLWEREPIAMRAATARHDALIEAAVAEHHGMVVRPRGEGDSRFAVFARASDAVAAALTVQWDLTAEPWPTSTPLRVRLALHTGEADLRDGDYYGTAVNRCARLRAIAHGGQALLSQATYDLVRDALPPDTGLRDLGEHRLRDLVQPEHVFQLMQPGVPADFPPLHSLDTFPHNLPLQVTSFVGRQHETAAVTDLLGTTRLLTLTGTGGCGKTRLALQVAAELIDAYPDGVWCIELAPLADPDLVPGAVAAVFGIREQPGEPLLTTLLTVLRRKRLLLLLDNCEHLLDAVARLADAIIHQCPGLQLVATSREALGVAGERAWRVPSLAVPTGADQEPFEQIVRADAVQLFAERARFARADFAVTERNVAAVVRVCVRLDGIPLALELAAARVTALSVEQLASRLDQRFRLLTGGSRTALPRQQTLLATVDWSYQLLEAAERALLRRLAVFAGGWTLEAAEAVCADDQVEALAVLDLLVRLVDKSLVVAEGEVEGATRYRLLETVRQYGGELLAASGEAAAVHERHAHAFLTLVVTSMSGSWATYVALPGSVTNRIERDYDNIRLALRWLLERDEREPALRLAAALTPFWHHRGNHREGRQWLADALGRAAGVAPEMHAAALLGAAVMAMYLTDSATALAWASEARSIYRAMGQRHGEAQSLLILGNIYLRATQELQDYEQARVLLEASLAIFDGEHDRLSEGTALHCLGLVAYYQGDLPRSRRLQERVLMLQRELGEQRGIAASANWLGHVAVTEGALAEARALYTEGLRLHQELRFTPGYSLSLSCFANLAAAAGQTRRAIRLGAAASAQAEQLGIQGWTTTQAGIDKRIEALRMTMPVAEQAAVWAEGQALTLEQAIAYALAEEGERDG